MCLDATSRASCQGSGMGMRDKEEGLGLGRHEKVTINANLALKVSANIY